MGYECSTVFGFIAQIATSIANSDMLLTLSVPRLTWQMVQKTRTACETL